MLPQPHRHLQLNRKLLHLLHNPLLHIGTISIAYLTVFVLSVQHSQATKPRASMHLSAVLSLLSSLSLSLSLIHTQYNWKRETALCQGLRLIINSLCSLSPTHTYTGLRHGLQLLCNPSPPYKVEDSQRLILSVTGTCVRVCVCRVCGWTYAKKAPSSTVSKVCGLPWRQ